MTEKKQIYKCDICWIITEVINEWWWQMSCCGQNMTLITENTEDAATEKHIPIIKELEDGVEIIVGSVEHPMIDTHFIEWIEVITKNKIYRQELFPLNQPKAKFCISKKDIISVRTYCNLHGLWKA